MLHMDVVREFPFQDNSRFLGKQLIPLAYDAMSAQGFAEGKEGRCSLADASLEI